MTNRTVEIYGYGFGPSPATTTVTLDGNVVFSGSVTTTDQPVPPLPNQSLNDRTVPLFSFELPIDFQGAVPMTCQVTNGTIVFAQVSLNYCAIKNPVFSDSDWAVLRNPDSTKQQQYDVVSPHATPPFTQEETDILLNPNSTKSEIDTILSTHGVAFNVSSGPDGFLSNILFSSQGDPRTDIFIDDVQQHPNHDLYPGTYWWAVSNGQTLSYNLNVTAGKL